MVEKALGQFRGKFMQLPPLYSALKMNGKPLYEYAREGKEIPREIEKRAVEVTKLELLEWMEGGTHDHRWPTEEADEAEKDVAEKVWQQEKGADANKDGCAEGNLAAKKRKLEENQDELVSERPASKQKISISRRRSYNVRRSPTTRHGTSSRRKLRRKSRKKSLKTQAHQPPESA